MDPLTILDRMDTRPEAPARWPPAELDQLIDDWRTAATEQWEDRRFLMFALCAAFALACRNARFFRRMTGRYDR
jgi:hypothetical protein